MKRLLFLGAVMGATAAGAVAAPIAAEIPQWRAVLLAAPSENSAPRIRISHHGPVLVDRSLPPSAVGYSPQAVRFDDGAAPGHTLVWADVVVEGRDTQTLSVLYDFAPGSRTPRVTTHSWSIFGYDKRKAGGRTAFVTADPVFYGLFDARQLSVVPILVQAYRSGAFTDVTSAYPKLVAAEAAKYRAEITPGRCNGNELLGAYLVDMVRLGQTRRGIADITRTLPARSDKTFFGTINTVLHDKKLIPATEQLTIAAGVPRCDAPN